MADPKTEPAKPAADVSSAEISENRVVSALTELVEKATGKNLKKRINWETVDRGKPASKVQPGTAMVSDRNGAGMQEVELFYVCDGSKSAQCHPVDGRRRGAMVVGSLYPQIKGGELVLHQYTPYPKLRDDGVPHVIGEIVYPHMSNPAGWEEIAGTYYNKATSHAAEMKKEAAQKTG
jgi:hypothetical protein